MAISIFPQKVITISTAHKHVHDGRYFSGGYYSASLADTASVDILVQLTHSMHAKLSVTASGDSTIVMYKGATFSAAGTGITMSNHNEYSSKVFGGTVTHTPTLTGTGTQIDGTGLVPGGTKHTGGGGDFGFANEFILNAANDYLFRITNVSGAAEKISISLDGYQPSL